MNERLQLALEIAREAAHDIAEAYAKRDHVLNEKSANDFSTETDARVEAHLVHRIRAKFPGDSMLGEEGGERAPLLSSQATGYRWIIDPLDGTFNFAHGFPYFATSIAVEISNEICAAVVVNPLSGEMFYAQHGGGAWLQGIGTNEATRLRISGCDALEKALIASVLPSSANPRFASVLAQWTRVASQCASIRRTGAAALDLAYLAAGRLDGFFVMSLSAWDAAAGALLVREAGGHMCDFSGGRDFLRTNEVIAGTAPVCRALVRVLGNSE